MIDDIRKLVIDDVTLETYEASLRELLLGEVAGCDRLRYFIQLMIMSRICAEAIEKADREDMVSALLVESDQRKAKMDELLCEESSDLQKKYAELLKKEKEIIASFRTYFDCLESVAGSIRPWDETGEMGLLAAEMKEKLAKLEEGLQTLVKLRQSEDFAKLCNMDKELAKKNS